MYKLGSKKYKGQKKIWPFQKKTIKNVSHVKQKRYRKGNPYFNASRYIYQTTVLTHTRSFRTRIFLTIYYYTN